MLRIAAPSLILAVTCYACFAFGQTVNTKSKGGFAHSESNGTHYYTKQEPSGCMTKVRLRPTESSRTAELSYGAGCEVAKAEVESVSDVANSFVEIVEANTLKHDLKERKILAVNYIWKIAHWPIIESINSDSTWPDNIFKTLSDEYPDDEERYLKYIEILRSKILEHNVYYPFIKAMQKIGCLADVQEYYADPIFMGGKFVTKKEDLVKWGVYTTEQAKKEIYPYFKSSITFSIDCQSIPALE